MKPAKSTKSVFLKRGNPMLQMRVVTASSLLVVILLAFSMVRKAETTCIKEQTSSIKTIQSRDVEYYAMPFRLLPGLEALTRIPLQQLAP